MCAAIGHQYITYHRHKNAKTQNKRSTRFTWQSLLQYLAPHLEQQQNDVPVGSSMLPHSARWQLARHNPGGARAVAFSPASCAPRRRVVGEGNGGGVSDIRIERDDGGGARGDVDHHTYDK